MKTILKLVLPMLSAMLLLPAAALAEIKTETVEYKEGETALEGFVAYDDAVKGARPGVLVVHDWMGLKDHTKGVCEDLAKLGYVAFAADIYGKGVRPADRGEAGKLAGKYKADRALLRERVKAGLAQLTGNKLVEPGKVAAIGFCFGGTTAIELGRSGADIAGVVTFHGGLDLPTPADGKNIKAKMLILHGADDPFVKPEDIAAFRDELDKAGVDWQMIYYSDAVHAFTEKYVGTDKASGAAYNEKAARRSWQAMKDFFGEIFGK